VGRRGGRTPYLFVVAGRDPAIQAARPDAVRTSRTHGDGRTGMDPWVEPGDDALRCERASPNRCHPG